MIIQGTYNAEQVPECLVAAGGGGQRGSHQGGRVISKEEGSRRIQE